MCHIALQLASCLSLNTVWRGGQGTQIQKSGEKCQTYPKQIISVHVVALANFLVVGGGLLVALDLPDEEPHDLVGLVGEGVQQQRLEQRLRDRHFRQHRGRRDN